MQYRIQGAYAVPAYFVLCSEYPIGNGLLVFKSFSAQDDIGGYTIAKIRNWSKKSSYLKTKQNKAFGFILRLRYFLWGIYILRWQPNYLENIIIIFISMFFSYASSSTPHPRQWVGQWAIVSDWERSLELVSLVLDQDVCYMIAINTIFNINILSEGQEIYQCIFVYVLAFQT